MTGKGVCFSDLLKYLDEYVEFYGLNHSEKLVVKDFCDFIYHRYNGLLKIGDEVKIE